MIITGFYRFYQQYSNAFHSENECEKISFSFSISQRYGLEWELPFLGKKFCLLKNQNLIVFSKIILSFSPFQAYQAIHIVCLIILDGIFFCCLPSKWIIYVFTGLVSQLFDFTIFYYCPLKQLEPMCFIKFRLIIELSSFEWEPKTEWIKTSYLDVIDHTFCKRFCRLFWNSALQCVLNKLEAYFHRYLNCKMKIFRFEILLRQIIEEKSPHRSQ